MRTIAQKLGNLFSGSRSTGGLFAAAAIMGLAGCTGAAQDSGSTGVAVSALASTADGVTDVVFTLLPGHVRCPRIGQYRRGHAYDDSNNDIGNAILASVRPDRVAYGDAGSRGITEDAFFDNVATGPFTICARPSNETGVCHTRCDTSSTFGNAREGHKTHVDIVMTCNTPGSSDVGVVAEIQNTPSIDVTAALEVGVAGPLCSTPGGDMLSVTGQIQSPDGTPAQYSVEFVGPAPAGVTMSPTPGTWVSAAGGFMANLTNSSNMARTANVKIKARTPAAGGGYLYAHEYTLTFEWRLCR